MGVVDGNWDKSDSCDFLTLLFAMAKWDGFMVARGTLPWRDRTIAPCHHSHSPFANESGVYGLAMAAFLLLP